VSSSQPVVRAGLPHPASSFSIALPCAKPTHPWRSGTAAAKKNCPQDEAPSLLQLAGWLHLIMISGCPQLPTGWCCLTSKQVWCMDFVKENSSDRCLALLESVLYNDAVCCLVGLRRSASLEQVNWPSAACSLGAGKHDFALDKWHIT